MRSAWTKPSERIINKGRNIMVEKRDKRVMKKERRKAWEETGMVLSTQVLHDCGVLNPLPQGRPPL
jgi:hypothetical protein